MAENTIIVKDFLMKETIDLLDRKVVVAPRANRAFEGQLKMQGDTVTVQTFPRIALVTGGTAGDDINATNFAITAENFKVEQVAQIRVPVKDREEVRSNLNLQSEVAKQFAYSLAQEYDEHVTTVALAGAGNSVSTAAITKSNIYAEISKMRVLLSKDDAMGDAALFVNPDVTSLIRQAPEFDGYREGLSIRENPSFVGRLAGFSVYETNVSTLGSYMLAFDRNSVHFAEQMMKLDVRKEAKGFRTNVLLEALYQAKVFPVNANKICKHVYTLG